MKRLFLILMWIVIGAYALVHIALASAPVQRRIVAEIRKALEQFGYSLEIESIEFAAFTPKIYLNRVALSSTKNSPVPLAAPIRIDKIKIQFQPLALFFRTLLITEATLFNPKILIPHADLLYKKIEKEITKRGSVEAKSDLFTVVFKKMGVVDAVFNVDSSDPQFAIRSPSLSFFVENKVSGQRAITVETWDLELDRGPLNLVLSQVDLDLDLGPNSLRVNHAIVEGKDLRMNVTGITSLPFTQRKKFSPGQLQATLNVQLPLALLNKIPELDLPQFEGIFSTTGNVELRQGYYSGKGELRYAGLSIDGHRIGTGSLNYTLLQEKIALEQVDLKYAGGSIQSDRLLLALQEGYKLSGEVRIGGVQLNRILDSVKVHGSPVNMQLDGKMDVSGTLKEPLRIHGQLNTKLRRFKVVSDIKKPDTEDNTIIGFNEASITGGITFFKDKFELQGLLDVLGGKAQLTGYYAFSGESKASLRAQDVSLTELRHVAGIKLGGQGNLSAEFNYGKKGVRVTGNVEIKTAELARLALGDLSGVLSYQDELLSFEQVQLMTGLEPVTATGFIDFSRNTRFKFRSTGRRIEVDRLSTLFKNLELPVPLPKGGELSTRLSIEGGHDANGLEVRAAGDIKSFRYFDEFWASGDYSIIYRPAAITFEKVALRKKSGEVLLTGRYAPGNSVLNFESKGLALDELDLTKQAPLVARVDGTLKLEGDLKVPDGTGKFTLSKLAFREKPLPNSTLDISVKKGVFEVIGNFFGNKLRGRWIRKPQTLDWQLLAYFEGADAAPVLSLLMGKDVVTISEMTLTGDLSLTAKGGNLSKLSGSGTFVDFMIGLKDSSMRNRKPIEVVVKDGAWTVEQFTLLGADSQISGSMQFVPQEKVALNLDGKFDLRYVQPFIPGLDYAAGKVSVGVRVSGTPKRYDLLGNISLEEGTIRLSGMLDDVQGVNAQLSLNDRRINIVRLDGTLGGGSIAVKGAVELEQLTTLKPNLILEAKNIGFRPQAALYLKLDGDFFLKGDKSPYLFGGNCRISEGTLSSLDKPMDKAAKKEAQATLSFDVKCQSPGKLFVKTKFIDADMKGNFHLVGDTVSPGLLGQVEMTKGVLYFRDRPFTLSSGSVRFESEKTIAPRFNVAAESLVKENKLQAPQEYQVRLLALGTPADFKIRLSSTPALEESDIISLLVLGVTTREQTSNYVDLGTALIGQLPLSSKIGSELGVDIRFGSQASRGINPNQQSLSTASTDITVPVVQIEKSVTDNTKVSVSNSLEDVPVRELKIEHELNKGLTVNGSWIDKPKGSTKTQTTQSYGVDVRYRFQFE